MNTKDQTRFDALKGASSFGVNNASDFKPANGAPKIKAQALFASLGVVADGEAATTKDTVLGNLVRAIKTQDSGKGDYHGGTASKSVQREGLMEVLRSWNRTAAAIATAQSKPEMMENFRIPHGTNDTETVARARAIADAAEPLKAEFVALAHPADFVDALRQRIADFEAAADDQSTGLQDRAGATAGIGDLIGQGLIIMKQLDAIMHNLYTANPQKLAAWTTASNIARSAASVKQPTPEPSPKPALASPPSLTVAGTATLGSEVTSHGAGNGASSNGNETNGSGAASRVVGSASR